MIKEKRGVILVVFMLGALLWLGQGCTLGQTTNGTTCPFKCKACLDDGVTCTSCCGNYYLTSASVCSQCILNCYQCSIFNSTASNCTICYTNYAVVVPVPGQPSVCSICSSSTALECDSVNACSVLGTCLDCRKTYYPSNGVCNKCRVAI